LQPESITSTSNAIEVNLIVIFIKLIFWIMFIK